MAQVHNHYMKFVLFLFISSQVQGDTETKLLALENSTPQKNLGGNRDVGKVDDYNPIFADIGHELYALLKKTDKKIQSKLMESYPEIAEMKQELKDRVDKFIFKNQLDILIIFSSLGQGKVSLLLCYVAQYSKDEETAHKIFSVADQISRIEDDIQDIVKPIIKAIGNHININELITKNNTKDWAPMIKKVGDAILTLIPDKKNETMSTNINHKIDE